MDEGVIFSPNRNNNKEPGRFKCVVENCSSQMSKNKELIFHNFPRPQQRLVCRSNYFGTKEKVDKLSAWMKVLKVKKITSYSRVCSLHFQNSDYMNTGLELNRILKPMAVPSVNLPLNDHEKKKKIISKERRERRERRDRRSVNLEPKSNSMIFEEILEAAESLEVVETTPDGPSIVFADENLQSVPDPSLLMNDVCVETRPVYHNVSIQVNTFTEQPIKFLSFIKDDASLSAWTGLENFSILKCIIKCVKVIVGDKFEKNYLLNTEDRIIMSYIIMKMNLSYTNVAILFHISAKHCQRLFYDTLKVLRLSLDTAIKWPSKEEIAKNMPKCFEGFENVRVVLDCTEIFIERPSGLCCQMLCYSNYKHGETVKFMTGVTPAALHSFVSRAYGGRASDSQIFHQSKLVNLLEPGDGIMVDRGFRITEVCSKNNWKLIQPPDFEREKGQFTKSEMNYSIKIAAARVHIERVNQRLKIFNILSTKFPAVMLDVIEDVFNVLAATVNLASPVLARDKFFS